MRPSLSPILDTGQRNYHRHHLPNLICPSYPHPPSWFTLKISHGIRWFHACTLLRCRPLTLVWSQLLMGPLQHPLNPRLSLLGVTQCPLSLNAYQRMRSLFTSITWVLSTTSRPMQHAKCMWNQNLLLSRGAPLSQGMSPHLQLSAHHLCIKRQHAPQLWGISTYPWLLCNNP